MTHSQKAPVLLYDGVCHLCDSCVQFVLQHEKTPDIHFCHLQSASAKKLLSPFDEDVKLNTVYFIENNRLYERSRAVLKVAGYLNPPWCGMRILKVFPQKVADAVYDYMGKNRYRWFGQSESCILPGVNDASRFYVDLPIHLKQRETMQNKTIKSGKYRHYKGHEYQVYEVATHSEDETTYVVYRPLYGEGKLWIRPFDMFVEEVEVEGKLQPRFAYVGPMEEGEMPGAQQ